MRSLGLDATTIDVDRDLERLLADASPQLTPVETAPDTPALLVYTSGTTGPPKGALHGHRVLPGHLPGFELSHDFFPQPGDRIWTPADWAWIGGLYDVLVPSLAHGTPVVAFRARRFDPEQALDLMAHVGVRNVFMPATALRLMRRADGPAGRRCARSARGGETVGEETAAWCSRAARCPPERVLRADRGESARSATVRPGPCVRGRWGVPTRGTTCG